MIWRGVMPYHRVVCFWDGQWQALLFEATAGQVTRVWITCSTGCPAAVCCIAVQHLWLVRCALL
jgi:hypothetical protein